MSLRLPKAARLSETGEFAQMRRDGTSYPGRYFVLAVLRQGPESGAARVGLITSKKVGNSVVRHRVRRRLRELFRTQRPWLQPGMWLVLIARAAAAKASFAMLQKEWESLGRRGRIFLPPVTPEVATP